VTREADKNRERLFVECCARLLGANWSVLEQREAPDFLMSDGTATFGLEVTQAYSDEETASGSKLRRKEGDAQKVMQKIRREHKRITGLTIDAMFFGRPLKDDVADIVAQLISLNLADRPIGVWQEFGTSSVMRPRARRSFHPMWTILKDSAGWVDRRGSTHVQRAVSKKTLKLQEYRSQGMEDIRLLVVADSTLNSGKVALGEDDAIDIMGFNAVYFLRHPLDVSTFEP
jgi:hypothetical protein